MKCGYAVFSSFCGGMNSPMQFHTMRIFCTLCPFILSGLNTSMRSTNSRMISGSIPGRPCTCVPAQGNGRHSRCFPAGRQLTREVPSRGIRAFSAPFRNSRTSLRNAHRKSCPRYCPRRAAGLSRPACGYAPVTAPVSLAGPPTPVNLGSGFLGNHLHELLLVRLCDPAISQMPASRNFR